MNIEDDVSSGGGGAVYDSFNDEKLSLHSGGNFSVVLANFSALVTGNFSVLSLTPPMPWPPSLPTLGAPKVPLPSRILA